MPKTTTKPDRPPVIPTIDDQVAYIEARLGLKGGSLESFTRRRRAILEGQRPDAAMIVRAYQAAYPEQEEDTFEAVLDALFKAWDENPAIGLIDHFEEYLNEDNVRDRLDTKTILRLGADSATAAEPPAVAEVDPVPVMAEAPFDSGTEAIDSDTPKPSKPPKRRKPKKDDEDRTPLPNQGKLPFDAERSRAVREDLAIMPEAEAAPVEAAETPVVADVPLTKHQKTLKKAAAAAAKEAAAQVTATGKTQRKLAEGKAVKYKHDEKILVGRVVEDRGDGTVLVTMDGIAGDPWLVARPRCTVITGETGEPATAAPPAAKRETVTLRIPEGEAATAAAWLASEASTDLAPDTLMGSYYADFADGGYVLVAILNGTPGITRPYVAFYVYPPATAADPEPLPSTEMPTADHLIGTFDIAIKGRRAILEIVESA